MSPTLFLEAFGHLDQDKNQAVILAEEEDLYSVFRARSELMLWSYTSMTSLPRLLHWGMQEAELTAGIEPSRIGWVQVGLDGTLFEMGRASAMNAPVVARVGERHFTTTGEEQIVHPVEPAEALPAVSQCFEDALRRFGDITLSGLQVMASDLRPRIRFDSVLISGLNWFNLDPHTRAKGLIAFNQELLGDLTVAALVARLHQRNSEPFSFGPVVSVAEPHLIQVPSEMPWLSLSPSAHGVAVILPEWTASAVGWAIAFVIDTAFACAPNVRQFAVRVTQIVDGKRDLT